MKTLELLPAPQKGRLPIILLFILTLLSLFISVILVN